ncbi:hypothetical protein ABR737_43370 [Streptomyces sp. Edi2]|uniref:hypothetical protein n=1 Tax=Streptomyces sp. Edi2 TaxID=3162528 RepID=UPI003305F9FE
MAQEDDHLLRLTAAGARSPDYRVSAGTWEGGRPAVTWIDGVPLWRALTLARGPKETVPQSAPGSRASHAPGPSASPACTPPGRAYADVRPDEDPRRIRSLTAELRCR